MFSRRGLLMAGGAYVCALTGCSLTSLNLNLLTSGKPQETVLNGSLEATTEATRSALSSMGLFVESSRDTDRAILSGLTKNQRRFKITLRRHKAPVTDEVQTLISVQWETDPDEQFWLDLLAATARGPGGRNGGR